MAATPSSLEAENPEADRQYSCAACAQCTGPKGQKRHAHLTKPYLGSR